MQNKCFLIMQQLSTYYKDPRFQVNHSVTFFDNVVKINFCMSPIYTTMCMKFSV